MPKRTKILTTEKIGHLFWGNRIKIMERNGEIYIYNTLKELKRLIKKNETIRK